MPFDVRWTPPTLRIAASGTLCTSDFDALVRAVLSAEAQLPYVPHRITDLTQLARLDIGFADLDRLAALRRPMRFKNSFRSALVAQRPAHFGAARMFQTLNAHPQITVEIFPTVDDALAWLHAAPISP